MRRSLAVLLALGVVLSVTAAAGAKVLRVGSYKGVKGQFTTIQAAVHAAKPGDWILLGPGDYKTTTKQISAPKGHANFPAAVLVTKGRLHIRGMNRNTVVVDGTKPGSAKCSSARSAQNFGLESSGAASPSKSAGGYARIAASSRSGVNGLMVWKAPQVSIENLTACNFLGGAASAGNEIWWNGGADTGKVGGHGYYGAYLSTTSTFFRQADSSAAAQYGVFSSNWSGGTWDQIYGSNFNDSAFYIGACRQICDQTVNHAHGEYSALGYSGTNSGGRMLIENSEFDNNQDGFDTNSQNADEPAPQNGACPNNAISPITHTHSCWVFMHNYVHDNNNPNVPAAGTAASGPVGTGMSVSGARNDTIMNNTFVRNNAWGVIFVPFTDSGKPCLGGTYGFALLGADSCLWDDSGLALLNNKFGSNGSYGNPTNGDFAQLNLEAGNATDCYNGNTEIGGASIQPASAAMMQTAHPACDGTPALAGSSDGAFLGEVLCDSQIQIATGVNSCQAGDHYPRQTRVVIHPMRTQKTMPNVCRGVPANPWCHRRKA